MESELKNSSNWNRRVSTKFGLWLILSLVISILIFAFQISEGEYQPIKAVALSLVGGLLALVLGLGLWRLCVWLFCWKNFKLILVRCGFLLLALLLVRLEENWRGKYAWEKFRQEWESKGEKFDFKSSIPPRVRDSENFALASVVTGSYAFLFDSAGHRFIPPKTNIVNRLDFNIYGTNWFAWNSENSPTNGDWEKSTLTDLKSWQAYYRNSFYTNENGVISREFAVLDQPQSSAKDILMALSQYDAPLKELNDASQLPQSRFPLNYDSENPSAILLPHLASLKKSAQVLQLRSLAELENGENTEARRDTLLLFQLTEKVRSEPFLISHLVRVAIMQMGIQIIYEGLAAHRWAEPDLIELSKELSRQNLTADFKLAMRGEAVFQVGVSDYLRKHPRELVTLLTGVSCLHDEHDAQELRMKIIGYSIPPGWIYQNQRNSVKSIMEEIMPIADETNRSFSVNQWQKNEAGYQNRSMFSIFQYFKWMLTPALGSAAKKFALCQDALNFSIIGMTLERHRLATGEYPGKLEMLTPKFIPQLPCDAINGQQLKYRPEADGRFVLYSVGWNETDDGGVVAYKEFSPNSLDIYKGDWVWRYPAK